MLFVFIAALSAKLLSGPVKVDGLIRLMEGENTGPINIGNPGWFAYWFSKYTLFVVNTICYNSVLNWLLFWQY